MFLKPNKSFIRARPPKARDRPCDTSDTTAQAAAQPDQISIKVHHSRPLHIAKYLHITSIVALTATAIALAAIVPVGLTLALNYITTKTGANVANVSPVRITVTEPGWTPGASVLTTGSAPQPAIVPKNPTVTNNSNVPIWVRVTIAGGADYFEYVIHAGNKNVSALVADDFVTWNEVTDNTRTDQWMYYDFNENDDLPGAFYWGEQLAPGATTTPIFEYVRLTTANADVQYADNLDIVVYAESVQTWVDMSAANAQTSLGGLPDGWEHCIKSFWVLDNLKSGNPPIQ